MLSYEEAEALGQPLRSLRIIYCPTHAQPMQLLCATCESLTCTLCEPEHTNMGHKIVAVNEIVVEAIKKDILQHANRVGTAWSDWLGRSRQEQGDRVSVLAQQHEVAFKKKTTNSPFRQLATAWSAPSRPTPKCWSARSRRP